MRSQNVPKRCDPGLLLEINVEVLEHHGLQFSEVAVAARDAVAASRIDLKCGPLVVPRNLPFQRRVDARSALGLPHCTFLARRRLGGGSCTSSHTTMSRANFQLVRAKLLGFTPKLDNALFAAIARWRS